MYIYSRPVRCVACCTAGNDLARVLGWGRGYSSGMNLYEVPAVPLPLRTLPPAAAKTARAFESVASKQDASAGTAASGHKPHPHWDISHICTGTQPHLHRDADIRTGGPLRRNPVQAQPRERVHGGAQYVPPGWAAHVLHGILWALGFRHPADLSRGPRWPLGCCLRQ
jgi:hypothetical protein